MIEERILPGQLHSSNSHLRHNNIRRGQELEGGYTHRNVQVSFMLDPSLINPPTVTPAPIPAPGTMSVTNAAPPTESPTEEPQRGVTLDILTPEEVFQTAAPTRSPPTYPPTETPTTMAPRTRRPSKAPTESPTKSPTTAMPTVQTEAPTDMPTIQTEAPTTDMPTIQTASPTTATPTIQTQSPTTEMPTEMPTESLTTETPYIQTEAPTESPTTVIVQQPEMMTEAPTLPVTAGENPTVHPTFTPNTDPTLAPIAGTRPPQTLAPTVGSTNEATSENNGNSNTNPNAVLLLEQVQNIKNKSLFYVEFSIWSAHLDHSNLQDRIMRSLDQLLCDRNSRSSSDLTLLAAAEAAAEDGGLQCSMNEESSPSSRETHSQIQVQPTILSFAVERVDEAQGDVTKANGGSASLTWSEWKLSVLITQLGTTLLEGILQELGASTMVDGGTADATSALYEEGVAVVEDTITEKVVIEIGDGTFDHLLNLVTNGGTMAVSSIAGQERDTFASFATPVSPNSLSSSSSESSKDNPDSKMLIVLFFAGLSVGLIVVAALLGASCKPRVERMARAGFFRKEEENSSENGTDSPSSPSSSPEGINTVYVMDMEDNDIQDVPLNDAVSDYGNSTRGGATSGATSMASSVVDEADNGTKSTGTRGGGSSGALSRASSAATLASWSVAGMDVKWSA